MMISTNKTNRHISEFVLICLSEIQTWQHWISIPHALLFLVIIGSNLTLLVTIYSTRKLHHPMCYCLCLFALTDLLLTFSISPTIFAILWFDVNTISSVACFSQIFLTYFCQAMETAGALFLAFDRYVAICNPLHYSSVITNRLTAQAVAVSLAITGLIILPFPCIAANLTYCAGNAVAHCFCESLVLAELACGSTTATYSYALVVAILFTSSLSSVLVYSYTMIIRAVLRLGSTESARKAFNTCSSHLIVIAVVYSIVFISALSSRLKKLLPQYVHTLLAILRYLTLPALNPLVYGIRTRDIHQAIKKLCREIWYQ